MPMDKILVLCRIRPLAPDENEEIVTFVDDDILTISATNGIHPTKSFRLDHILDESSTQDDVFAHVVKQLDSALKGFNNAIITYGQTGSGTVNRVLNNLIVSRCFNSLCHRKDAHYARFRYVDVSCGRCECGLQTV
jgi:hypothetical protein